MRPGLARPRQEVVVTRDDPSLPGRCRPKPIARVVLRFFKAMAEEDRDDLERLFGPDFKWFSVTGSPVRGHKRHFLARQPHNAIDYITERGGFNLVLSDLVVDDTPTPRHSDIFYNGVWKERGTRWLFVGKGAINCRERTVKVWSMSGRKEKVERGPALCPLPEAAPKPSTPVACTRQS